MLPFVYGFQWSAGYLIFLGAFFTVVTVIAIMMTTAFLRSRRALLDGKAEAIQWHSDFHELPERDRACRHEMTGRFKHRTCPNEFDCRECETHGKLVSVGAIGQAAADSEEILGLRYPGDRLYHRGHAWAKPEADGTVTIGLDDLGARLVGKADEVVLPKPGDRVQVNGTGWKMVKAGVAFRILSPTNGRVVETDTPESGWYLKVKPEDGETNFTHLLTQAEVKPWLMREMERLQILLSADGMAPSLADGGVPVEDIPKECPDANWDAVWGEMFLHP